jgi:hypothetical protein
LLSDRNTESTEKSKKGGGKSPLSKALPS